jgi:hypothetical protein
MSARLVWIATCEVCETTTEFDGSLTVKELGDAARVAGWKLPGYGGMFCARCAHAVKVLRTYGANR